MSAVVHLVDSDAASQARISRVLQASGFRIQAYRSAEEILDHLPDGNGESCIVIDAQIPGVGGPDLFDRLIAAGSTLPVIFLAGIADIRTTVRAIKAGAEDFLPKPVRRTEFIEAVNQAIARRRIANEQDSWVRQRAARLRHLTPREREVFDLVVRGRLNKQIAFELGTTERTVKAHRHKVMEKMEIRSVAELASCAERLGLLRPAST
ncbi:response regulator transcription factor [Bosea thiooxidans]